MNYSSSVDGDGDVFLAPRRLCLAAVQSGSGTGPWAGGDGAEGAMYTFHEQGNGPSPHPPDNLPVARGSAGQILTHRFMKRAAQL